MLYDVPMGKVLTTDWFHSETNTRIRQLRPGELAAINAHINTFFDAHVTDPHLHQIVVPLCCPHPWPPVLDPVYRACGGRHYPHAYEEAGMFLGNLFCRVAIARREWWWTLSQTRFDWKPRTYVLGPSVHRNAMYGLGLIR